MEPNVFGAAAHVAMTTDTMRHVEIRNSNKRQKPRFYAKLNMIPLSISNSKVWQTTPINKTARASTATCSRKNKDATGRQVSNS